jgi:hypothetical protein
LLDYGLGAATKPIFALAGGVGWIVAARLTDRVGKSIRDAAFGLRQAPDSARPAWCCERSKMGSSSP